MYKKVPLFFVHAENKKYTQTETVHQIMFSHFCSTGEFIIQYMQINQINNSTGTLHCVKPNIIIFFANIRLKRYISVSCTFTICGTDSYNVHLKDWCLHGILST